MSPFELATAGRVLFGAGVLRQLAAAVVATGARAVLLVTGLQRRRAPPRWPLISRPRGWR